MDICIFRIVYPNDPNKNLLAHQHFVGFREKDSVVFYSVSSILNKEYKVYPNGVPNSKYYILDSLENKACGFKMNSFIDCSKGYLLRLDNSIDLRNLSNRNIPSNIRKKILFKINELKFNNEHTLYDIDIFYFKKYNPKVVI